MTFFFSFHFLLLVFALLHSNPWVNAFYEENFFIKIENDCVKPFLLLLFSIQPDVGSFNCINILPET